VQRLVAQVYVGIRGRALTNLCANFDLQIANDGDDEDVVASWTFCSLMGLTRKIDLILCSGTFTLSKSFAANQLELASDHRAVYYTGVRFPRRNQNRQQTQKENTRIWKPQCFGLYHATLSVQLRHLVPASSQGLERAVSRIATAVHEKKIFNMWNPEPTVSKTELLRPNPTNTGVKKRFGNSSVSARAKNATIAFPQFCKIFETWATWRRFVLNHYVRAKRL
jgi:hypothetical protein